MRIVPGSILFCLLATAGLQGTTLGVAAPWNAFIFDSISYTNTAIQAGVAAGSSITLTNMTVASAAASGNTSVEVLSAGSVNLQSGFVNGSIQYATTGSSTAGQPAGATFASAPSPFDFAMEAALYRDLSTALGNQAPNGTVDFQFGTLSLTGTQADINYFVISPLGATANNVVLRIPTGATAIITLANSSVFYQYGGIDIGSTPASHVLWNLPTSTSAGVTGVRLPGAVLAPRALVDLTNGSMRGQVIANQLIGSSFNLEYEMFNGSLPNTQVPEPSTFALAASALACILLRARRR